MIESSKDILYLVIAISIAILTVFFVWSLYYIAMILKRAHQAVEEVQDLIVKVRERVEQLESLIKHVEEKITSTASYLPLVVKGLTELIGYFKKKRQQKKTAGAS